MPQQPQVTAAPSATPPPLGAAAPSVESSSTTQPPSLDPTAVAQPTSLSDRQTAATTTVRSDDVFDKWLSEFAPSTAESPLLQGGIILLFSLLVASLMSWFLKRVAAKWFSRTKTDFDDDVLAALSGPVYVTMLAIGFRAAVTRLNLSERPTAILASLLATLVILVWLRAALRIAKATLSGLARTGRVSVLRPDTVPLFSNLTAVALFVFAVYLLVISWGGNVTGLLALGGVGGLIIGLAAQDSLGNLFAGMSIFADSPYKVGDYINLDTGERGMVTNIGLRSTRVLTRDDVEITIPNSAIAAAKIVNETGGPHSKYRIRIPVGVAYGSDIARVREVLLEVAAAEELAEKDPEPRVRMRGFGASSLDFELLCWISAPELRGGAIDQLLVGVYQRFLEHGIEIPYAKSDLYLKEIPKSLEDRWAASTRASADSASADSTVGQAQDQDEKLDF